MWRQRCITLQIDDKIKIIANCLQSLRTSLGAISAGR